MDAMQNADVAAVRRLLLRRDDLLLAGWQRAGIERAVAGGELRRLRRGWYIQDAHWRTLWPESRHRAHVVAVHEDARRERPVFALTSAAVLHGLPLYRVAVPRVHTAVRDAGQNSHGDVVRHAGALADDDVVEVDGMRCTSVQRTVYDLLRLTSPEVGIACIDAVLGQIGGSPRRYDDAAAERWLAGMADRMTVAGVRGIRQAHMLLAIADGRAEQPLEAVTTLQLHRLGFRGLELQVPVPGPGTKTYWIDIGIEEIRSFYECDGKTKYTDEALRSGRTLEHVLLDEKQREDWVRGTTDRRVLRGGSEHSVSPAALAKRLTQFGVALPPRSRRLILPRRPLLFGQ